MSLIGHSRNECPGCRRTTAERHARDCPISHGRILGEQAVYRADYVDARYLKGAVSLSDEQWARVLWWLHTPTPPGPAKALDETIIRAINSQRGR